MSKIVGRRVEVGRLIHSGQERWYLYSVEHDSRLRADVKKMHDASLDELLMRRIALCLNALCHLSDEEVTAIGTPVPVAEVQSVAPALTGLRVRACRKPPAAG